jgi:hypothetical protein
MTESRHQEKKTKASLILNQLITQEIITLVGKRLMIMLVEMDMALCTLSDGIFRHEILQRSTSTRKLPKT